MFINERVKVNNKICQIIAIKSKYNNNNNYNNYNNNSK